MAYKQRSVQSPTSLPYNEQQGSLKSKATEYEAFEVDVYDAALLLKDMRVT